MLCSILSLSCSRSSITLHDLRDGSTLGRSDDLSEHLDRVDPSIGIFHCAFHFQVERRLSVGFCDREAESVRLGRTKHRRALGGTEDRFGYFERRHERDLLVLCFLRLRLRPAKSFLIVINPYETVLVATLVTHLLEDNTTIVDLQTCVLNMLRDGGSIRLGLLSLSKSGILGSFLRRDLRLVLSRSLDGLESRGHVGSQTGGRGQVALQDRRQVADGGSEAGLLLVHHLVQLDHAIHLPLRHAHTDHRRLGIQVRHRHMLDRCFEGPAKGSREISLCDQRASQMQHFVHVALWVRHDLRNCLSNIPYRGAVLLLAHLNRRKELLSRGDGLHLTKHVLHEQRQTHNGIGNTAALSEFFNGDKLIAEDGAGLNCHTHREDDDMLNAGVFARFDRCDRESCSIRVTRHDHKCTFNPIQRG
mmetsp:Transcript_6505/g.10945  ORF Transcript_6505/g.10945 Transcript_6505/m.10945 type:complete len:418 (-) Transcript_6505:716-1969(-)